MKIFLFSKESETKANRSVPRWIGRIILGMVQNDDIKHANQWYVQVDIIVIGTVTTMLFPSSRSTIVEPGRMEQKMLARNKDLWSLEGN